MKMRRDLLPLGILTSLPLVLYAPFLFGGKVLYWGVYLLQFYPWRLLAVEQMRAGHWPLWNPYVGAGTPLAANLQTAAFYPPNVLFLLMPVERAFGWGLALHIAIAGMTAYALGRVLGLSRFGSLVAGLTYGGGGYLVARWLFPSMVYAAAWLPLMMTLAERLARGPVVAKLVPDSGGEGAAARWRRARYTLLHASLLALTIGLQSLAGHAQTSFYSALIVGSFAVVRTMQHSAQNHSSVRYRLKVGIGRLASMAVAAIWGMALAAIQLLPSAEFAAHSQRAGRLTDLTFAFELSFWPARLLTLFTPDLFGNPARSEYWGYGTYWEEAAFVGLAPLLLVVAAVIAWRQGKHRRDRESPSIVPLFGVLAFVSIMLALGNHTPLYPLFFQYVPGFGLFQAPARLMIGYALAVPVLAAVGVDLFRPTPRARAVLRLLVVAGLGTALAGALARWTLPEVQPSLVDGTLRLGVSLALAAAVLVLRGRRLSPSRWQALAVAVVSVELVSFGWGLAPAGDASIYHAEVKTAEFLKAEPAGRLLVMPSTVRKTYDRYISLASFGSADPAHLQGLRESLMPDLNTIHQLPAVGNYDPLTVGLYDDLFALLEVTRDHGAPKLDELQPVLDLFGARYLFSEDAMDLPLLKRDGLGIYLNEPAMPAAYAVHQAAIIPDAQGRLDRISDPSFDPRREVILSEAPRDALPASPHLPAGDTVQVTRPGPSQVLVEVEMAATGYLVLADTHYPGWRATVDGQESEILAANHAFRAVAVGEGRHTVLFEYEPDSFRSGAWVSLGAAAALVAALCTCWALKGADQR